MRKVVAAGVVLHNRQVLGTDGMGSLVKKRWCYTPRKKRGEGRKLFHMAPRTAECIRLTALGYTGPQIAQLMRISYKSINVYKSRFKRQWCPGAGHAILVAIALREKLVTAEELISNAERYLKLEN